MDGHDLAAMASAELDPELRRTLEAGEPPPAELLLREAARLRAELDALAAYIPARTAAAQLASPAPARVTGAYWEGTALFADLSGFTALSEQLSGLGKQGAEEVSAIVSRLFSALLDEIHRRGGALLKFGGDALTTFFDSETLGEAHAACAAAAGLAMQARMAEFASLATRAGNFALRLRIGVHSGRIFAAEVGDAQHIELVVTGRAVNRVALAQEIAEPGEVVVSSETLAALGGEGALIAAPRRDGFFALAGAPPPAPAPLARARAAPGRGDMAEVRWLAERAAALRPYLPHGIPRRFIGGQGAEALGEFRPVTVAFVNVADFSALLEEPSLGAEAAAAIFNAYYRRAQAVVHHYGGIVNKVDTYTRGDKLMALFGAPAAHEDDPLRAVRAALDMRPALAEANEEIAGLLLASGLPPAALEQRAGVNTGVVFAGRVGSAARHEYTVMGPNVNLAARLMSAAAPGSVTISPATRRLVDGALQLRALAPIPLKGLREPVAAAEVLRLRAAARDAQQVLQQPGLVGRAAELGRLSALARAALLGDGRAIAVVGEAGAGKTRLVDELVRGLVLGGDGHPAFLTYQVECQSYDERTPFAAARELLRQLLGLVPGAEARPAAERRAALLAPELARFTPLLGDILGADLGETPLTAALQAEQRHERAVDLIEAMVLGEARRQPLVLIVDDLQWCDASSREVIARLAAAAAGAPLLAMLAYRPDPPAPEPWAALPHAARVDVRELGPEASAELAAQALGGAAPPELAPLVARAQGNPFFIEEIVRELIESGALRRGESGWRMAAVAPGSVPDSIEGVIMSRLDRLDEQSRDVVQVASVIGRHFPYPLLAALLTEHRALRERLGQLTEVALIQPAAIERELEYLFRHALTRDVAYESILYARRRALHQHVAHQIERAAADSPDDQLALLAWHYQLAEEWRPAFDYALRAGRMAQRRYANHEAVALLGQAIDAAARIPGDADARAALVEVHERMGWGLALLGQYDAALERFRAALALLDEAAGDDLAGRVRLHHHIARAYEKRADFDAAFGWVERALALDPGATTAAGVRAALLGAGLHMRQGRYPQAVEWGERASSLAERDGNAREQAQALKLIGNVYSSLGELGRAQEFLSRSLALAEQAQDLDGISNAHNDLAVNYHELGRLAEAREHYRAGAAIKQAIGDVYGEALVANNLGELLRLQGDMDGALAAYRSSLESFTRIGAEHAAGLLHMNLGATSIELGQLDAAGEELRRAGEIFARVGAEDFLPELERAHAELALRRGDAPAAAALARRAIETAARLDSRVEEAVTRRVLGRALAAAGDREGAWRELRLSVDALRESDSAHEAARSALDLADLAPALGRAAEGLAAIAAAVEDLRRIAAHRDLERAAEIAARHAYPLPDESAG